MVVPPATINACPDAQAVAGAVPVKWGLGLGLHGGAVELPSMPELNEVKAGDRLSLSFEFLACMRLKSHPSATK
jgi:hypothetical protein